MKITFEDYDQLSVMTLHGDVTADDVGTFRKVVAQRLDQQVRDFVFDMGEVDFVDSAGLEALLWLRETCEENLGQVRLAGPTENVSTILRMTRLAGQLACHEDIDAAIKSLR